MPAPAVHEPDAAGVPAPDDGLADTEAWYRGTFQAAGAGIAHVAPEGRFLAVNDRFCAIVGRAREELLCLEFRHITHPQDLAGDEVQVAALLAGTLAHYTLEKRYLRPDGTAQWVQLTVGLARHPDGRPHHLVTVIEDIGARKAAEAALAEREAQLALFVEHAPAAIAMFDRGMRYLAASRRYRRDYGFTEDLPLVGRSHYEVFPEIPLHWRDIHARVLQGEEIECEEDEFPRAAGHSDWVRWSLRPWRDADGQVAGVLLFSEVITEQVQARRAREAAQAALARSLEAHEALLHELNHRVKNNLQLINSLLTLQARSVRDADAREALAQARARVGVMAQLHQQLYLSGMHGRLDFARHGRRLATDTLATIARPGRVALEFECDADVSLPLDQAVPLSLIVSELITNAVKYAFPDGRRGTLALHVRRRDGELQVLVADDGPGLRPDFELDRHAGLGLHIVQALVRQLHGRLELPQRAAGAAFLLVLPHA